VVRQGPCSIHQTRGISPNFTQGTKQIANMPQVGPVLTIVGPLGH
jgi:hypothetical protein